MELLIVVAYVPTHLGPIMIIEYAGKIVFVVDIGVTTIGGGFNLIIDTRLNCLVFFYKDKY